MVKHTDKETLLLHVHRYTDPKATIYTDEWRAYEQVVRKHQTVEHGIKEWARDDDGDGIREVHVNTIEGLWTSVRNFLRSFRGVHKRYLGGYVAMWNSLSTSSVLAPPSSLHLSLCTLGEHEPSVYGGPR